MFPLLPVLDIIPPFISPYDSILIFILATLLGINLLFWKNWTNLLAISILCVLFVQDQNRWQPWAYIYFIFLIFFSFYKETAENRNYLAISFRLMIIGVYLWSGVHKLNTNFINQTFESILIDFFDFQDKHFIDTIKDVGYLIPIFEVSICVFLFIPKLRNIGVSMAIIAHIFILLYLSPLGINKNYVVFPWNIAMTFFVVILFYQTSEKIDIFKFGEHKLGTILIAFLFYIFPFLNIFGLWDNYLSFSLYSSKTDNYYIVIAESQLNKVDERLAQYYLRVDGLQGGQIIDVGKWSTKELNVPFYPETRTFKKVAKTFCRLGIEEGQLYFLELNAQEKGKYLRYICEDL